MANLFTEQENVRLHVPSQILRQRLKSAPEKLLQSPMMAKTLTTPLPSGRRAFGAVNKKILTPVVNAQEKKLLKPQETKVKLPPLQIKVEEYPEKELFIPYDPLEFERYSVPEDTVPLSCFALPGLACFTQTLPNLDEEKLEELPNFSPVKMPESTDDCQELAAFLQTLDELTELPSESEF